MRLFAKFTAVGPPRWASLLPLLILLAGPTVAAQRELKRFEFTQAQMGMLFRIVLYAPDPLKARSAAGAAFKRIEQLNQVLSDYDADTELSQLCRTSGQDRWVPVSQDLWDVLARSQALAQRSHGAFDITVGPAVNLWRRARRRHELPPPALLAEALRAIGYQKLQLDEKTRSARLLVPNMRLDVGGIGKGYAVDGALKVLRQHQIHQALVAGAGDMAVSDAPPGRKGWRVEIAPLDAPGAPPARFALLDNMAIATSGDLFQRLEIDGKRYSHIVDPRTGIGLTNHSLVTVIAPDCTTADSLTKVVSVLGLEEGLCLVEKTPGSAAQIVQKPGDRIERAETRRFHEFLDGEAPGNQETKP